MEATCRSFLIVFCGLCAILFFDKVGGAGYLYGVGFSPFAGPGYGNYGFGSPYSRYGYGYGNGFYEGYGGMGMGGFGGMAMGGFGPYMGMMGGNYGDWTLRSSAYGLGYGFPHYG